MNRQAKRSAAKTVAAKSAAAQQRRGSVNRETKETAIRVDLNLDGSGTYKIDTGIPFLDHMLESLSRHSMIDLEVNARGDIHIDDHHTVEDVGIAIGQAMDEALGDKKGILRFGSAEVPLDEALVGVTVDLSGRPFIVYNVEVKAQRVGKFDCELINDFMQALMNAAGMNLHINMRYGRNAHHIIEAMFKALARALSQACTIDARIADVPSTKGSLRG